jgi:hypothetical protein
MRNASKVSAILFSAFVFAGCPGVPYNPATNSDITPPDVGIRVTGDAQTSIWVADSSKLIPRIAIPPVDVGVPAPATPVTPVSVLMHERGEASILATAQDNESGVKSLKLFCQRRVYYNYDAAGPTESNAVLEITTTEQNNQLNNGQAPKTALTQQVVNMWGRMLFRNSQGTNTRAHRVSLTCSAEASNFNGNKALTKGVLVWAQDRAVQP